jgi:hypothetical protein
VGTAIFYSILISSRLDNSPLKSLWTIVRNFFNFAITLIHHKKILCLSTFI